MLKSVLAGCALALSVWSASWAVPPVEDYGKLPATTAMKLSPSGERMAFISVDHAGARKLVVMTVDGKPLSIAALNDNKARTLSWADDDHLLIMVTAMVKDTDDGYNRSGYYTGELPVVIVLNLKANKTYELLARHQESDATTLGFYGTAARAGHAYA